MQWGNLLNRLNLHKYYLRDTFTFVGVYAERREGDVWWIQGRNEQGREMFGGGGMLTMGNCLTAIFLLSAFLIQTRARYEKKYLYLFQRKGYKVETNVDV